MMELKTYQLRVLDAFSRWLEVLEVTQNESKAAIEAWPEAAGEIPDAVRNYPLKAWEALKGEGGVAESAGEYVDRTDDAGSPIPHICFKVPTGGGKTLLAAAALERRYQQTGLILWVVPTKAIYAQTRAALWNREHPYRQMLERASAGRVKMLEKDDPFNSDDVANYLCVMLLSLSATNRHNNRDFLRMFRNAGRYPSFFSDGDDLLSDGRMMKKYPDLECNFEGGSIKHSLGNVFKIVRPVVVLDEAHKAYGASNRETNEEFTRSINRLNPQLVVELSATPNRGISNLLVDIEGPDLKKEEMIKLPVQVTSFPNAEWRLTLGQAVEELDRLETEARSLEHNTGRYIRPIAVVRVERTGNDKRDNEHIHAEDVREYLTQNLNLPSEAVRVKSATNDELGREDLLSEFSEVRWIITKSALMEGWDCPFAYLLVMLDNTRAQRAITQLVGRVMRQPGAQLTGRELLDQCYVYCNNAEVGTVVEQVKNGLEAEGLTGLGDEVMGGPGSQQQQGEMQQQTVNRREQFQGQDIFLPVVSHKNGEDWVQLDYQSHILPHINWSKIEPPDPKASAADSGKKQSASVNLGEAPPVFHPDQALDIDKTVKVSRFARHLSDILPNPWQAARIADQLIKHLKATGDTDADIYDRRAYLAHLLREHVKEEVETQAEQVFHEKLRQGEIRFDLEVGQPNFRMKHHYEIQVSSDDRPLLRNYEPVQLTLFEPVFERDFDSELEKKFAYYLDEQRAVQWWHRVAVRQQGEYSLQGWKQGRIYPDFVAMASETRLLIFETKGEHLLGNPDTEYKRKVLQALEGAFNDAGTMRLGESPNSIFRLVFSEHDFSPIGTQLKEEYSHS